MSVKWQVERILDEDTGRLHNVIVQMEEPREEYRDLIEASTEAMRRRYLTMSARELTPPPAELILGKGGQSSYDRRRLRASANSMTSQVALAAIGSVGLAALRASGLGVLEPLLTSAVVKEAIDGAIRRSRGPTSRGEMPAGFQRSWSSRSAVLRLSRNELATLPDQVPNISGIFPNSHVTLPPVVEVKNVPQEIADHTASAWGLEKIGALSVWGAYGTRGKPLNGHSPIKVAVLDTGVDPDHPELQGKIMDWAEFDDDGERIDSTPHDSGQHGTHVCGTIAGCRSEAPSKDHPLIGVAPDVELMAGLVLKGGRGSNFQIIAGLDWAIENGADVINMSLGGVGFEPDVRDIFTRSILNANRLGIPVVIAIGNEGAQTSGAPGNDYFAFSVGATDHRDRSAGFSGGRTQVIRQSRYINPDYLPLVYSKPDLTAPGVAIRSCVPGGDYGTWNGTSMATPHVAGAVALLLAATNIRSVPAELRAYLLQDLIVSAVEELGEAGRDHRFGFGRLNALRAIAIAKDRGY